ncbi:MAG: tetratricopeptide repeat protein [Deltaproteobacteria bacterium]|nr:tetratricopeptide repeat protein [Deltaproteobacteria bacterium]
MTNWKITGIIATIVIILSIPLYTLKTKYIRSLSDSLSPYQVSTFVGSKKCMDCHKKEYDKWHDSHHDLAMDVANENTVLGDFDNAVFEYFGVTSRFFRKDGRFFVHTQGPDGKIGEFEIKNTFGVDPLQQYLVPFPGGRLQCLPMAWDVNKKKWYHLYPDAPIDPKDWLYWTNAGQNWNGMCAECHSTNLKKNYDIKADSYQTTWSEIDVSCEACHGPGSRHVEWAKLPDMARPQTENYELVVRTAGINSRDQVELCAPCHSLRAAMGDYTHAEADLLDSLLPSPLTEGLYFADGQILEEVYVYASFTQSKMYRRNVRCSDCHDVHSTKTVKEGNELCLQCHRASVYDTKAHHFHKKKGEKGEPIKSADGKILFDVGTGAECIQCHMPGRYYMVIDNRADHSLRIPRPDMSIKLGTPNACNHCHVDKTNQWSDEEMTKWYGPGRRPHYGIIIYAGRKQQPDAQKDLIRLAGDPLFPVIVRVSALSNLAAYPSEETTQAYELALLDEEALIRRTAVNHLNHLDKKRQISLLASMIYDPVKAVRMEAATRMTEISDPQLDSKQKKVYQAALLEYQKAMEYSADFAFSRYNLGNLYANLRQPELAVENYRMALRIDNEIYAAKVNLAMLYNQMGKNDKAEVLLREVVTAHPELYEVHYSLGLLLAEEKKYVAAEQFLAAAARGIPNHARVHYNLGLLLDYLGKDPEAEAALLRALEIEPDNMDFLQAAAEYQLKRKNYQAAKRIAEQMIAKFPLNRIGHDLLNVINRHLGNSTTY